jgi:hypothetical protein
LPRAFRVGRERLIFPADSTNSAGSISAPVVLLGVFVESFLLELLLGI